MDDKTFSWCTKLAHPRGPHEPEVDKQAEILATMVLVKNAAASI